ncbi:sensor histidine kinase [Paenibacillus sp. GCM10027626]|uniref:sensor histidine kinase n=1 Tax=Paenibacillus sp. GCM10027626 TaxID=3273411 RepID=UPI003628B915
MRLAKRTSAWLAPIVSLAAALTVLAAGWSDYARSMHEEGERLSLYWLRYATSYYEIKGEWADLSEPLRADVARYPGRTAFHLTVTDTKGVQVADVQSGTVSGTKRVNGGKAKPVMVQGEIVGYTAVETKARGVPEARVWWRAAIIAAVTYGVLLIWHALSRRKWQRQMNGLAERVRELADTGSYEQPPAEWPPRLPDDPETGVDSPLAAAYAALERIRQRVQKLETVRRSMVADIAHELRTPLAVMRTQLDNSLQAGGELTAVKTAALYEETLRMSKLVHDLQELALAETGHLPLDKRWFSLTELAASVADMLAVEAEDRGLTLFWRANDDVRLYADQGRIRQTLINLIGNALRHARSQVVIETGLREDGQAGVVITDDGWGIEEEELPHLFERFYRGQSKGAGLGLGLAIAEQYARAHGGLIEVESSWGQGASFTLILPVMLE